MRFLITAGNTQTPLDRVRCITNVFSGRTGTNIAAAAHARGHDVCLLTSRPELVERLDTKAAHGEWQVRPFRTFDDLHKLMADAITTERFDAIVHCAAVSDFQVDGVFAPANGTEFDSMSRSWHAQTCSPRLLDAGAGKVKSNSSELWLRLIPTPKLIDRIRDSWGFSGLLVKFKLEVKVTDAELQDIADRSRRQSRADLIVANTLEGMQDWAMLGDPSGPLVRIERRWLAGRLIDKVEQLHQRLDQQRSSHDIDPELADISRSWQGFCPIH